MLLVLTIMLLPIIHALADSNSDQDSKEPSIIKDKDQIEMKYTSAQFTKPEEVEK